MAETGQMTMVIDAKTASALNNLAQVANKMDQVKKKTQEAGKAGKEMGNFAKGVGAQMTGALGAVGLGGIAFGGGLAAVVGSSLFAVGELIANKITEANKKLAEQIAGGDKRNVSNINAAKSLTGLTQASVAALYNSSGSGFEAVKALQDEVGLNMNNIDSPETINRVKKIDMLMNRGIYRSGFAKYMKKNDMFNLSDDELAAAVQNFNGKNVYAPFNQAGMGEISPYSSQNAKLSAEDKAGDLAANARRQLVDDLLKPGRIQSYIKDVQAQMTPYTDWNDVVYKSDRYVDRSMESMMELLLKYQKDPAEIDATSTFWKNNIYVVQMIKELQGINANTVNKETFKPSTETEAGGR